MAQRQSRGYSLTSYNTIETHEHCNMVCEQRHVCQQKRAGVQRLKLWRWVRPEQSTRYQMGRHCPSIIKKNAQNRDENLENLVKENEIYQPLWPFRSFKRFFTCIHLNIIFLTKKWPNITLIHFRYLWFLWVANLHSR